MNPCFQWLKTGRLICSGLLLCAVLLASGCRSTDGLQSSNPYERAAAAVQRAEQHDLTAVHQLVTLLEDRDPAVRLYSVNALERLCGTRYGYVYYDPPKRRAEAVARWRAALAAGEVSIAGHAPQPAAGVEAP